jgi:DUF1009 family protein
LALNPKLGIIAGNGRFPFLVLVAARAQGYEVVVAAIKEETSPEIESRGATVHWLSLGELSKLIETFRREGVTRGQAGPPFASPRLRLPRPLLIETVRNSELLLQVVLRLMRSTISCGSDQPILSFVTASVFKGELPPDHSAKEHRLLASA